MISGNRCKCSGACNTRRCPCKKKGIDCSSFCHSGKDCENKKCDHSPSTAPSHPPPPPSVNGQPLALPATASSHPPPPSTSAPPPSNVNGQTMPATASSHPPPPSTSAPPPSNVNGQPLPATASSHHPKSTHTATSCNCRTRCHGRKRCPCKQAGVVCSNSCHPGRSCVNDCHAKKPPVKQLTIADVTTKSEKQKTSNLGSIAVEKSSQ